jgi:hypothetical protein
MKSSFIVFCLTFILFFNSFIFAQGEAAVPFLLLQPSPSLSAMGQTGTALPTDDPFGFIWNPAQLGYSSQNINLSYIFYPNKLDWLPVFNLGLEVKGTAFNAGYNFKELIGFPISAGFGYSKVKFEYGTFIITDPSGPDPIGTSEPEDYYNAYSFGLGIDYYIQFNAGFTIKDVTSILSDSPTGPDSLRISAEASVVDFGIILNVPIIKLIDKELKFGFGDRFLKPNFNFSLGYSRSNIGDDIMYSGLPYSDPLPRMSRFGYGISTGLDMITDEFNLNTFNFALTVEADDILIGRDSTWFYQSTLSDLKFWKNLINIEGTDNIVSHIGLKFDFFETFTLYTGHFSGRGFDERKTNGYEIKSSGLFKLWALWANDPITDFISNHFDVRYYNTKFFADHEFETRMTGLAFHIKNINKLF